MHASRAALQGLNYDAEAMAAADSAADTAVAAAVAAQGNVDTLLQQLGGALDLIWRRSQSSCTAWSERPVPPFPFISNALCQGLIG